MTPIGEPLDVAAIRGAVTHSNLTIGADLHYFAEVDSTNRVLHDFPAGRWSHGTVILTDYQTEGRGRGTRRWNAPPMSSVLLSIGLSWPSAAPLATATMVAGLSAGDAIQAVTGLATQLKWPNDVVVDDKKVGGILCEGLVCNGESRVIVGLGVNANFDIESDAQIPATATSLWTEIGGVVCREQLTFELLRAVDNWCRRVTTRPESVFENWRQRISTLGREVTIDEGHRVWHGRALDVNGDGGLVAMRDDGSSETVYAASISLRDHPGSSSL